MARLVQGENSFPREDTLDREGCCISRGCDHKHNWIGRLVRWGAAAAVGFFGRKTRRTGVDPTWTGGPPADEAPLFRFSRWTQRAPLIFRSGGNSCDRENRESPLALFSPQCRRDRAGKETRARRVSLKSQECPSLVDKGSFSVRASRPTHKRRLTLRFTRLRLVSTDAFAMSALCRVPALGLIATEGRLCVWRSLKFLR